MAESRYTYDIDERPPLRHAVVYGLQWAVLMFPALIIVVNLAGAALHLDVEQKVLFLQLTLLTSGFFTLVQCLWGHRYPVLEGPATALLLTFMVLASYGPDVIQGGMILGGMLLIGLVLLGKLKRALDFATPNVVGVILMLIAFTLLPHLTRNLIGVDDAHPGGEAPILFVSLFLVICMAAFAHWFKGFWKTVALLAGILLGSAIFLFLGRLSWQPILEAPWASMPNRYTTSSPVFYWPAVAAFASAYLAVIVNSLGSLQGVAGITDSKRLPSAVQRGVFMNGVAGVFCGLLGIVGMVSYSLSPGVILANRVASRYAVAYCGGILITAAFVPKLAALLALAPAPVVGAALCVAMGGQVGAGMAIIMVKGLSNRDYFVVGLPVLIGTIVGYLPRDLLAALPPAVQVFLGNGLIMGIFLVLLLEHLVLREASSQVKPVVFQTENRKE